MAVLLQCTLRADNNETTARSGKSYVEAAIVCHESNVACCIRAHCTKEDHLPLLACRQQHVYHAIIAHNKLVTQATRLADS